MCNRNLFQTLSLVACLLLNLLPSNLLADHPTFNSRVVAIGGGACVTPQKSFHQPVFSYVAPVAKNHIVTHHDPVIVNHHGGNDVNTALKIITNFKIQQQTLDQGLQSLGYGHGHAGYGGYGAAGPYVNYGLAPYEQGTTQFQVQTYNHQTFEGNVENINDKLQALLRLSENMQRSTATVTASVSQSVATATDAAAKQAEMQAMMQNKEIDAATKMAMLQILQQMLQNPSCPPTTTTCPPGTVCPTPQPPMQPTPQVPELSGPIVEQPVEGAIQPLTFTMPKILQDLCAKCHTGESAKGGFSMDGPLSEEDYQLAAESVFKGEMPKGLDRKLTIKEIQQVVTELEMIKQ